MTWKKRERSTSTSEAGETSDSTSPCSLFRRLYAKLRRMHREDLLSHQNMPTAHTTRNRRRIKFLRQLERGEQAQQSSSSSSAAVPGGADSSTAVPGSRSQYCHLPQNIHIISISRMLAHERSTLLISTFSSSTSPSCTTTQVMLPINEPCAQDPQNEEYGSVAKTTSSTDYEPDVIDRIDYSEICTAIFQNESVNVDTEPSHSFDAELDDELIRRALIFAGVHSGARRTSELLTNML